MTLILIYHITSDMIHLCLRALKAVMVRNLTEDCKILTNRDIIQSSSRRAGNRHRGNSSSAGGGPGGGGSGNDGSNHGAARPRGMSDLRAFTRPDGGGGMSGGGNSAEGTFMFTLVAQ